MPVLVVCKKNENIGKIKVLYHFLKAEEKHIYYILYVLHACNDICVQIHFYAILKNIKKINTLLRAQYY